MNLTQNKFLLITIILQMVINGFVRAVCFRYSISFCNKTHVRYYCSLNENGVIEDYCICPKSDSSDCAQRRRQAQIFCERDSDCPGNLCCNDVCFPSKICKQYNKIEDELDIEEKITTTSSISPECPIYSNEECYKNKYKMKPCRAKKDCEDSEEICCKNNCYWYKTCIKPNAEEIHPPSTTVKKTLEEDIDLLINNNEENPTLEISQTTATNLEEDCPPLKENQEHCETIEKQPVNFCTENSECNDNQLCCEDICYIHKICKSNQKLTCPKTIEPRKRNCLDEMKSKRICKDNSNCDHGSVCCKDDCSPEAKICLSILDIVN